MLYRLQAGPRRIGDLKRVMTGISEKLLVQQLRQPVASEVVIRHDYREAPPKVDYAITSFGRTIF